MERRHRSGGTGAVAVAERLLSLFARFSRFSRLAGGGLEGGGEGFVGGVEIEVGGVEVLTEPINRVLVHLVGFVAQGVEPLVVAGDAAELGLVLGDDGGRGPR